MRGRGEISKRGFDLALTVPALIVLSPLLLALALAVKLDSPGPVLYRRRVMGRGGAQFDAFKFRTMHVNGDAILAQHPDLLAQWQRDQKLRDDPRVTRSGRTLRKLSLDELPQLLNVLAGEMSLVGPRMVVAAELPRYGDDVAELLSVRPGITGLWQVSGRSDVQGEARARLELEYVRTRSLRLDVKLLLLTVPAVLRRRGAY
jgi:lipopolysaccharide/colanic/teichoic acid biosynthesis glycosyltransferase